jgi:hypothetical protein
MNIDPLSEKYAYQSHYNFSENRVVDGRELEGLEVVLINPDKQRTGTPSDNKSHRANDQMIVNGAKKLSNSDKVVTVTGHGGPTGMTNDVRGGRITDAKGLNQLLNRNSDAWKNKESNEGMTVILYSCRTGADEKNKDGSKKDEGFAQKVSDSPEFKDVEIIAPDQRVYFNDEGLTGTYEAEYAGPNDEYKLDSNNQAKNKERSDTPGNWNVYKNNKLIRTIKGDEDPQQ